MAYKIIDREYKHDEVTSKITGAVCSIYCDTESDLPTSTDISTENILAGSWAWLGAERTFKTLSSGGEWI